jgi:hypothetical protein
MKCKSLKMKKLKSIRIEPDHSGSNFRCWQIPRWWGVQYDKESTEFNNHYTWATNIQGDLRHQIKVIITH